MTDRPANPTGAPPTDSPKKTPAVPPRPSPAAMGTPAGTWKARILFGFQALLMVLILALHLYATVDNFRYATNARWACLLTALVAILAAVQIFRSVGPGSAALVAFSLFLVPMTISAVIPETAQVRGFTLAGKDTGFWVNIACLGTILVMLGWVATRELAGFIKVTLAVPLCYCSLGFLQGLFLGAPLDLVVLGIGFLNAIPFLLQPASLYLNLFLPIVLLIIAGSAILSVAKGRGEDLPMLVAMGLFFALPFVMGLVTMNRYLIPNVSFLVFGKPVAPGYVKISYTSGWDELDSGARQHEVEIFTSAYKPGKTSAYLMSASVIPATAPYQPTLLKLAVKDEKRGMDVLNLVREDLLVREDGQPQKHLLEAQLDRKNFEKLTGRSVLLTLDTSGSMSNDMEALKAAATTFVGKLIPGYEVALVHFSSSIERDFDGFSVDAPMVTGCIGKLDSGGGTALYDSIIESFSIVAANRNGRGIVVLFSDGEDTGSHRSLVAAQEAVKDKGVQLFAIGFGSSMGQTTAGGKILADLAELTGGKYFHAADASELDKIFEQVLDFISCKYTLSYVKDLPPPPTIKISEPASGTVIAGPFGVKANVTGRPQMVEFSLDAFPLKSFPRGREGEFAHANENPDDHDPGPHTLFARMRDIYGRAAEDRTGINIRRQLPQVTILEPAEGAVIWKDGTWRARVDGQHYKSVGFLIDGKGVKTFPPVGADYKLPLEVKKIPEGVHIFTVKAVMPDGRSVEAAVNAKVMVPRPSVVISSPAKGASVFGRVPIPIVADSGWSETGLKTVRFLLDGQEAAHGPGPKLTLDWDTEAVGAGPHTLKAIAENEVGETAETEVPVEVLKPQFFTTINGISPGQVLRSNTVGSMTVVNELQGTTVTKVELILDGKPFKTLTGTPWDFKLEVLKMPEGEHELKSEAFRSDGKTFVSSVKFRTQPPKRVVVFFSTKDDKGKFVPTVELQKLGFAVKEDGRPVQDPILESAADLAVNFGIVMDVSGSMKDDRKLERAKEAASLFVDLLKSNDKAFIIRFSDDPEVVAPLTNDRRKLLQEIEFLVPQKGTALYDSMYKAIEVSRQSTDRPALVLLTDGVDENAEGNGPGSVRSLQEVTEFGRRQEVQIFTIGLGRQMKMRGSRGESVLQTFSGQTGGSYFFAASAGELEEVFRAIIREVGSQSKLSFIPPSGANDGQWHTIEISVPTRKDLSLIYKPGYLAK